MVVMLWLESQHSVELKLFDIHETLSKVIALPQTLNFRYRLQTGDKVKLLVSNCFTFIYTVVLSKWRVDLHIDMPCV